MPRLFLLLLPLCLLTSALVAAEATTETYVGKVVRIADGDTITVLVGKEQRRVRLEGIDCPERAQPFGKKASQFTAKLVFGKTVEVRSKGQDRYRRDLGHVYVDKKHVNAELLKAGFAWHYKQYNKDPALARLETEARKARRGLWADPEPVPPWEWRRKKGRRNSR